MIRWRIYYDDREPFDSSMGAAEDAPGFGVQAITTLDDCWLGGNLAGLIDYLAQPGRKVVRFGRMVSNERHEVARACALNDPDFPPSRRVQLGTDFYWWCGDG